MSFMENTADTPSERLQSVLTDLEISQRKFAKMIGMSANGLNSIVRGKKKVSRILALATENLTGVSAQWIQTGAGPKFNNIKSRLDPWDKLVLDHLGGEDGRIFDRVIARIESRTSPFRNHLFDEDIWNEDQLHKYRLRMNEIRSLVSGYNVIDTGEGQGPFRCALLLLSGFQMEEVLSSYAGSHTDERFIKDLERIHGFREELEEMINSGNKDVQ